MLNYNSATTIVMLETVDIFTARYKIFQIQWMKVTVYDDRRESEKERERI